MKILGIIPARYASTRFMGKPLVEIDGKTMIHRVYEQVKKAKSLSKIIVATDDDRIFNHVKSFGGDVMMTSEKHQSGTDRCAEVVNNLMRHEILKKMMPNKPIKETLFDAVVNIQGDEPFIDPSQINKVVEILNNSRFPIATLVKKMENQEDILNPNIVKCVFSNNNKALYFSRSPIPYLRNIDDTDWHKTGEFYKHIGLYAYRTTVLNTIAQLLPSRLEKLESLEQLRWLENGYEIGVAITDIETIGIDTPEDLKKI